MTHYEINLFALRKLSDYGLNGWGFQWCNTKKSIGRCNYSLKKIEFSKHWTHLPEEEIKDVVLHEIAHALTPGDGHGKKWKRKCLEIGAEPKRTKKTSEEVRRKIKYKYTAECKRCGMQQGFSRRWKNNKKSCGVCDPTGYNPSFPLTYKQNY